MVQYNMILHTALQWLRQNINQFKLATDTLYIAIQSRWWIRGDELEFNSSRPRDSYMRKKTGPSLVQIMACRLFGAKPLSEPMLNYCQLETCKHISMTFWSNTTVCIEENAFESVICKMASILTLPQCFKFATDPLYHALTGKVWGVCCEKFGEYWLCYNIIARY